MRVVIGGSVAKVTERTYKSNGEDRVVVDAYIGDAPYFDKVTMPVSIAPTVGETVQYLAQVKAKSVVASRTGERHTFLDVWCVEKLEPAAAPKLVKAG